MEKITVNIIATSDIHGYILPIKYSDHSPANIGLAKVATLVEHYRKENPTLLIDNGDILQGSPLAYYNAQVGKIKKQPIAEVLNYMNYDACVIGNHDFNYSLGYLNNYKDTLNCPLLSANITDKNEQYYFKPYIIKELDHGLKIAIIGVTTKYIPNWERKEYIKDLLFHDAFNKVKEMVEYVKTHEQVDCIIVSYHGGFERDLQTGAPTEEQTGENQGYHMLSIDGIDVLITGHQHRSIAENDIFNKAISQTANNGKEIALFQLYFEKINNKFKIVDKHVSLLTTENYEADRQVIQIVNEIEKETQVWLDQPLGFVKNGDLIIRDMFLARVNKHPLVTLINKVQMEASGADISITSLANEITGLNHEITMRDIISSYVFPNTLVVLEVTGQDIKDALEKTASYFTVSNNELQVNEKYIYPKPQHYNYDMYDGIDYEIHVREEIGNRIKNITYKGKALDLNHHYHVIMNNYRANGGGNFHMYKHKKIIKEITTDMVELLAEYVKAKKEIVIDHTSNINIIY